MDSISLGNRRESPKELCIYNAVETETEIRTSLQFEPLIRSLPTETDSCEKSSRAKNCAK